MRFGFFLPHIVSPIDSADATITCVRLAEAAGFDSIWKGDHLIVPAENASFGRGTEAITTLACLASATQRATLGLSVLVLPMRNPIVVAKQIATIMHFTRREIIVGVGVGWNAAEFGFVNADFERRGRLADEYIAIMRQLWTEDRPAHSGTYIFADAVFAPKPATPPQIWIGGNSEAALRRAATLGDGFQPIAPEDSAEYARMVNRVRELSGGRPMTMSAYMPLNVSDDPAATMDYLGRMQEAGLEHAAITFQQATLNQLVAQIEVFGRDIIPALGG